MIRFLLLLAVASNSWDPEYCEQLGRWLSRVESNPNAVEITHWPELRIQLRYADTLNFTGDDLYCGVKRAFLHKDAAKKLRKAIEIAAKEQPGFHIVIWDAARPQLVQQKLWDHVKGGPLMPYVSSPGRGSLHNLGMAIDITVARADGSLLDMGTDFDDFSEKAWAKYAVEDSLVKLAKLSRRQVLNRRILRTILIKAGFIQLPQEWWHFNAGSASFVLQNYGPIDP